MTARAVKRYERASALKVRRLLKIIKGQPVPKARAILQLHPSRQKVTVLKTLNSAVANLKSTLGAVRVDDKELFVKAATANEGPQMKRWRPGFRGSADMIRRRTCHITLVVDSYKPIASKKGE
jgi:large subunit ribosomal protein L22